jgi:hypothetical protein
MNAKNSLFLFAFFCIIALVCAQSSTSSNPLSSLAEKASGAAASATNTAPATSTGGSSSAAVALTSGFGSLQMALYGIAFFAISMLFA